MVDQFDRGMRRSHGGGSGFFQRNNLTAAGDSVLHASLNLFRAEEGGKWATPYRGARRDRGHFFAMTAQSDGLYICRADPGGARQCMAETTAIQCPCHAQHTFAREARGAQHLKGHFIKRVCHHDNDGIWCFRTDRFGGLPDHAGVDVNQVGTGHPRRARTARRDHNNLRACHKVQRFAPYRASCRAGDPSGMVQIKRQSGGHAGRDINQRNFFSHIRHCGEMRDIATNAPCPNQCQLAQAPRWPRPACGRSPLGRTSV